MRRWILLLTALIGLFRPPRSRTVPGAEACCLSTGDEDEFGALQRSDHGLRRHLFRMAADGEGVALQIAERGKLPVELSYRR